MIKVSIIIEEAELPLEFVKELIQKGMVDSVELPPSKIENTNSVEKQKKKKLSITAISNEEVKSFITGVVISDLTKMYNSRDLCKLYLDKQKEQYKITGITGEKVHQKFVNAIRQLYEKIGPDYSLIMERMITRKDAKKNKYSEEDALQIAFFDISPDDPKWD